MEVILNAVKTNNLDQARACIQAGEDMTRVYLDSDKEWHGQGLLYHSKSAEMTKLLLDAGTPFKGCEMKKSILDSDIERARILLAANAAKNSDLLIAAAVNSIEMVALILQNPRIDPNWEGLSFGRSALKIAARLDNASMVELLLRKGANPSLCLGYGLGYDYALHGAGVNAARVLIQHGASVVVRNFRGYTPLHVAASVDGELFRFLLEVTLSAPRKFPHPVFDKMITGESVLSIAVGAACVNNVALILRLAPAAINIKLKHPIESFIPAATNRPVLEALLSRAIVGGDAVKEACLEQVTMRTCFAFLCHAHDGPFQKYSYVDPVREAIMMHLVPVSVEQRAVTQKLCSLA
jgi:hypothetical protein